MEKVLSLIQDSRILAAKEAYEKILQDPVLSCQYASMIQSNADVLEQMLFRCQEVSDSFALTSATNENWILATNYLGVTTHYMVDSDSGYLFIRMESTQSNVPLMEQLSVVYEVSLFNKWIPFCTESSLVSRLNHVEVISSSCITALGISRDVIVHSYGTDCLYENGSIVVIGKSIDSYPGVEIPPVKGFFSRRATLQFNAVVTPFSPTSGHMIVVAKIDPKLSLPTSVINFTTKQIAGFFLVMIHQQAREIETNEESPYRECIRNNPEFYLHWILPKLRKYIDHNGWKQPDIACLGDAGLYRESDCLEPTMNEEIDENQQETPSLSSTSSPIYYPYIEGSVYKKGNGIISSVWSYRHFELDVHEQTLRWYKSNTRFSSSSSSSSSSSNRIQRGEISICSCKAELLTDKEKKKKYSKVLSGVVFVVKYSSLPNETTLEGGGGDGESGKEEIEGRRRRAPGTGAATEVGGRESRNSSSLSSPKEMYLSAPCLQEAYHWINHFNISSTIHLKPIPKKEKISVQSREKSSQLIHSSSVESSEAISSSSLSPSSSSSPYPMSLVLILLALLFPLVVFLFPSSSQVYVALIFVYLTPPAMLCWQSSGATFLPLPHDTTKLEHEKLD